MEKTIWCSTMVKSFPNPDKTNYSKRTYYIFFFLLKMYYKRLSQIHEEGFNGWLGIS